MMFKKTITKSGMKLLKALINVSKARLAKKAQAQQLQQKQKAEPQEQKASFFLQTKLHELDELSSALSRSLQDCSKAFDYYYEDFSATECCCCCCCCLHDEHDENQRNENLENEIRC